MIATRTAAASRSPQDRSFQISTIAMHLASPTMIRPVRNCGRSGSSNHASANIAAGPTIQFSTSDETSIRRSLVTEFRCPYRTLASTGYIISSSPSAIGNDTDPTLTASNPTFKPGTSRPRSSPTPMAARIHTGRKRSRTDNRPTPGRTAAKELVSAATRPPFIDVHL